MFQKIAPRFVYVFFSMLYLGYLKHALVRTYCYPRAVILVRCGVLDYIQYILLLLSSRSTDLTTCCLNSFPGRLKVTNLPF